MKLIDADELIEEFKCIISDCSSHGIGEHIPAYEYAIRRIEDMPTVDIEQKHGRWIVHHFLNTELECSECQFVRVFERADLTKEDYPTYCEQCGAKMDEGWSD